MKTTLLLLLISLLSVFGHYSWCAPGSRTYSPFIGYKSSILNDFLADTTKKKKETVITSVIDNEKGGVTVKDAQIFDSGNQAGLINITIVVRDVETHAQLVKIQLKVKDSKTGKEFEPVFSAADNGFLIKVVPETVVSIYVTAKGYTDASANINDIKHDRPLAFELQKIKPSIVKIKVVNSDERPIPSSTVKVKSKNTGEIQTLIVKDGLTELSYDSPDAIEIVATATGYTSVTKNLAIETALNGKQYDLTAKLERVAAPPPPVAKAPVPAEKAVETKSFGTIEKGKAISLNNIYFDQSSPVLRPESSLQLDELLEVMKQNPAIRVEIRGHTDNVGDFELNVKLSRDRCQSVVDYLIQKGINANRLQTVGRGPVDAVAPNTTEENRKKNRRVEFIVL
ncbi:OmpA family protein [Runella sp.]|jgi:outer membrane protein OmpA-like peptidoglycan-associated protein|uniref:OmpA family protein n=1 Tax=Runella sp. TaxID=1960881 RepID=UPI002611A809|nr:OmpA family protein [Runella sp.]